MTNKYENKVVLLGDNASVDRNDLAKWYKENYKKFYQFTKDADLKVLNVKFADALIEYLWDTGAAEKWGKQ